MGHLCVTQYRGRERGFSPQIDLTFLSVNLRGYGAPQGTQNVRHPKEFLIKIVSQFFPSGIP